MLILKNVKKYFIKKLIIFNKIKHQAKAFAASILFITIILLITISYLCIYVYGPYLQEYSNFLYALSSVF